MIFLFLLDEIFRELNLFRFLVVLFLLQLFRSRFPDFWDYDLDRFVGLVLVLVLCFLKWVTRLRASLVLVVGLLSLGPRALAVAGRLLLLLGVVCLLLGWHQ